MANQSSKSGHHISSYAKNKAACMQIGVSTYGAPLCLILLLTVCIVVQYAPWQAGNASLMERIDASEQHYLFFVYLGKWVRSIIKDLISGQGLSLSAWNLSCGFGSDMVTTLAAYIGDPFSWISVIIPSRFAEAGYELAIIARTYAAALVFLFYCRRKGFNDGVGVAGSLAYATCGIWMIAHYHPFFVNPMIYFPLAMLGADRVMEGAKPTLYVFSVGCIFLNYFYFGYMTLLLLVPYCLVAFFVCYQNVDKGVVRQLIQTIGKFVGLSILGIGTAAVLVFPIVYVIGGADRLSIHHLVPLLYDKSVYREVAFSLIGYSFLGRDAFMGFGVAGFIGMISSIVAVRVLKPHAKAMLIYTLVLLVFLCVPWFGHALNGFSYVASRWVWALSFAGCVLASYGFEQLQDLSLSRRKKAVVICGCYIMLLFVLNDCSVKRTIDGWPGALLILLVTSVCFVFWIVPQFLDTKAERKHYVIAAMVLATVVSCFAAQQAMFVSGGFGGFVQRGKALAEKTSGHYTSAVNKIIDTTDTKPMNWRVDVADRPYGTRNASVLQGLYAYDFYVSIYNNAVDRLNTSLGITSALFSHGYSTLDARSALEHALGTRFFVANSEESYVPYGYELVSQSVPNVYGAHGLTYRPIASIQRTTFSAADYGAATMLQRQEMLLEGVVLESGTHGAGHGVDGGTCIQVDQNDSTLGLGHSFLVPSTKGNRWEKSIPIHPDGNKECYLELYGIDCISNTVPRFFIDVLGPDGTRLGHVSPPTIQDHMFGGKTNWCINLGVLPVQTKNIDIVFYTPGEYILESASVRSVSLEPIAHDMQRLATGEDNVGFQFSQDTMTCEVPEGEDERYLVITTPWSSGWSATIDGNPTDIQKADIAFMAIKLPAGSHTVRLEYRTPLLRIGLCVSVGSIAVTLFLARRRCGNPER